MGNAVKPIFGKDSMKIIKQELLENSIDTVFKLLLINNNEIASLPTI